MEKMNSKMVNVTYAIAEAIRKLKSIPNGHLYAHVMGQIDFDTYTSAIAILKRTGLVTEKFHVLTWKGAEQ